MSDEHAARIERAFTQQAASFEDARINQTFTVDVEWLWEALRLDPSQLLLDVAAGTGHVARALAPAVRGVVALDATTAMLEQGRDQATRDAIANVIFVRGDASAMPFLDESFDVVVCRFATHHFEDPARQLAEMARCLRVGGQLALADLVTVEDPATAAEYNRLERLRDPSHTAALSPTALAALVEAEGLTVRSIVERSRERPLEPWLEHAATEPAAADAIRVRLREEIVGGAATGLAPRDLGGELHFTHRYASVTAQAPS